MHKDENKAIRYLMKEMDPSEEMEFEKSMREDENLLIEVESLRATQRRLSDLPHKSPPESLTTKIAYEAKQIQSRRVNSKNFTYQFIKKGLAAAILLSVSLGGYYYYSTDSVPMADSPQNTAVNDGGVSPWVDRNEVIRFSENEASAVPAEMEPDFVRSFEKLQLVNDPAAQQRSGSGILLTGSSN